MRLSDGSDNVKEAPRGTTKRTRTCTAINTQGKREDVGREDGRIFNRVKTRGVSHVPGTGGLTQHQGRVRHPLRNDCPYLRVDLAWPGQCHVRAS